MINIKCRTNLDLDYRERFPTKLPEIPRVGDLIQSAHVWEAKNAAGEYSASRLRLQVVRVTWTVDIDDTWIPEVELHLNKNQFQTINDFYEWYGRVTGRGKGAFI